MDNRRMNAVPQVQQRKQEEFTPIQAAQWANNESREIDRTIKDFLRVRAAREIEIFYECLDPFQHNKKWLEPAKIALQLRSAEELASQMAAQMDRLIQHTEKLTVQTDKQIQNSLTLSAQTAELVNESKTLTKYTKSLKVFTILLFIVAIIQVVLWCIDAYHKTNKEL